MNILHENTGGLQGLLKLEITEDDYSQKVDSAIRDIQKKAQMPGFRPGKVPMGMVKKLHGKNVLVEQVNKLISESIYNYIKDNDLKILGNPIPVEEKNESVDWDNQKEFEFDFLLGFAPEIDFELTNKIKVDYYKIKVEDKILDEQIKNLRQQYGKLSNPEESGENDSVFGELIQLKDSQTVAEEPVTNKATIYIKDIQDEEIKARFLSRKLNEQIVFDINKAFESKAKAAAAAGVKEEELPAEGTLFRFTIETISRIEPAELNEEFYKKLFPKDEIKTEEELREKLRGEVSKQYQLEVDRHFKNEAIEKLLKKADIKLPEEFIKKWLVDSNREELSLEKVEAEFDKYADSLRWQLLENKILEDHNVKVTEDEIKSHLREYVKAQFRQYGQDNINDEMMDGFVKNIMEKKEEVQKVSEKLLEEKIIEIFKNTLKLNEKQVTFDEFVNLVKEKYNKEEKKAK